MQVVKAYTEGQQQEIVKIEELVPRVLKQIQNQVIESEDLLKDDGSPNIESIKRYAMFSQVLNHIFKEVRILNTSNENFHKDQYLINPYHLIVFYYRLFRKLDDDHNSYLTPSELEKLMGNAKFREAHLNQKASVEEIMKDFDQNDDHMIDENEFLRGVTYWLRNAKQTTKEHHDKVKYILAKYSYMVCDVWTNTGGVKILSLSSEF